jgi:hypothetical protein
MISRHRDRAAGSCATKEMDSAQRKKRVDINAFQGQGPAPPGGKAIPGNRSNGCVCNLRSRYLVTPWTVTFRNFRTAMQDEAEIMISGVKLTDAESMTVRVAIDTLANVLAEGLEEPEGRALTEVYLASLSRIQTLLESRKPRTQ